MELLTVGFDDGASVGFGVGGGVGHGGGSRSSERLFSETAVFLQGLGSRSAAKGSGEIGVKRDDSKEDGSNGRHDCWREKYGDVSSERRVTAMTPELVKNHLVRLAQVRVSAVR